MEQSISSRWPFCTGNKKKYKAEYDALQESIKSWDKALSLDPERAVYYLNKCDAYKKVGAWFKAHEDASKALAAYRKAEQSLRNGIKVSDNQALYLNHYVLLVTDHIAPLYREKKDYGGELKAYREALEAVGKAVALKPEHYIYRSNQSFLHKQIGYLLQREEKVKKALDSFQASEKALRNAIELKKDDDAYRYQLALLLYSDIGPARKQLKDKEGEYRAYEQSAKVSQILIERSPKKPEYLLVNGLAHRSMGMCQQDWGKTDKALTCFNNAKQALQASITLDDTDDDRWVHLFLLLYESMAPLYKELGQFDEELEAYEASLEATEKASTLDPGNAKYHTYKAMALAKIGYCLSGLGKVSEALGSYNNAEKSAIEAKNIDKDNALYWSNLFHLMHHYMAPLCEDQADMQCLHRARREALKAAQKAHDLQPNNADYRWDLEDARRSYKKTKPPGH